MSLYVPPQRGLPKPPARQRRWDVFTKIKSVFIEAMSLQQCVQPPPLLCCIYCWLELCGHWLTGVEWPCFHWLTSGVSMFPLAGALASPLPQESLNKHNLWKKALLFPPERKENNPSLHSHCCVAPFWVIQILIHHECSWHERLKMTPEGFKDVSKIKCHCLL